MAARKLKLNTDTTRTFLQVRRGRARSTKRAVVESENRLHLAVAELLARAKHPLAFFYHVPNGEKRSAITGAKLKRMGTLAGVPDFALVTPFGRAAYLELKKPGRKPSDQQLAFKAMCERAGALWACVDNIDDAARVLNFWAIIRVKVSPVAKADLGVSGHDRQKGDAAIMANSLAHAI